MSYVCIDIRSWLQLLAIQTEKSNWKDQLKSERPSWRRKLITIKLLYFLVRLFCSFVSGWRPTRRTLTPHHPATPTTSLSSAPSLPSPPSWQDLWRPLGIARTRPPPPLPLHRLPWRQKSMWSQDWELTVLQKVCESVYACVSVCVRVCVCVCGYRMFGEFEVSFRSVRWCVMLFEEGGSVPMSICFLSHDSPSCSVVIGHVLQWHKKTQYLVYKCWFFS